VLCAAAADIAHDGTSGSGQPGPFWPGLLSGSGELQYRDRGGRGREPGPFGRIRIASPGRYYRTEMDPLLKRINTYLLRWARKKYKRLRSFKRLRAWWKGVTQRDLSLFAHWEWTYKFHPTGW
jgi:hypothetical protein